MLTKELLNIKFVGERVLPCFISLADSEMQSLAERMLSVYQPEAKISRGEIDEMLAPVIASCRSLRIGNGLKKILDDRAEYTQSSVEEQAEMRRRIFLASAGVLRNGDFSDERGYRQLVQGGTALPTAGIYSDLPENERLIGVKEMTPKELLERYNMGLIQGMLLYSRRLELELPDVTVAQMRRLMRAVRFFRLVADIVCSKGGSFAEEASVTVKMLIDGPGSVLSNSRSYGLQLGAFFPHVCQLPKWKMKAKVKLREKWRNLSLDESSMLVYHGPQSGAYIPEEVRLFKTSIESKLQGSGWHLVEECPCIKCKGGQLIFPDYAFMDDGGHWKYLELFHRWHSSQLTARLETLEKGTDWPLILGVDNAVASQPDITLLLEQSAYFHKNGFIYRDYPLPDKVLKLL